MNIKFYMSDLIGPGLIRGDIPAKYINRLGAEFRVDCKMDIMESDFFGTQVMVFQRGESAAELNRLLRARKQGIKTVYDIDDDLFSVPECLGKIHEKYNNPVLRDIMLQMQMRADAIFASSTDMADLTRKRIPNVPVFILPNYTDFELYDAAYWNAVPNDGIVIGWHGSGSHIGDIPLIRDALAEIMARYPKVTFKLMGSLTLEHFGEALVPFKDRILQPGWINYYELPTELAKCDLGLCPLEDIQFNRMRSTCKIQEYAAVGVPVVASPLPCYKEFIDHGQTGVLAEPESTGAWVDAIARLIERPDERRAIGTNARRKARAVADIRAGLPYFIEAYRAVCRLP